MPNRWNMDRWRQNEDGSYTRTATEPKVVEVKISKAAAELAEELGVDVDAIEGTGAGGGITKADVEAVTELSEVP